MGDNKGTLYAWLALWALLRVRGDDGDSGLVGLHRISALAGQFIRPASNAANDQPVALLILVWFWYLACAKYRAIPRESRPFSRKLPGVEFHPVFPAHTRLLLALPGFALILALCQNDHLPTPE